VNGIFKVCQQNNWKYGNEAPFLRDMMKITKVEPELYENVRFPQIFVRITTDEGLVGVGEAWWGVSIKPVESVIKDALTPLLIGEDSSKIEYLWQKMYKYGYRYGTEGIFLCGLSAVDLALWDLMGKRLDVPVAQLLGGVVRDGIKAYASFPPHRQEKIIKRELERAIEAGFAGIKLHELEERMVAAAREAAPDGFPIMVDITGHWTPLEAEENAKRFEKYDVYWLEEPIFPMQDHETMYRIRQKVNIKFAAGENVYTLTGFEGLMKSGSVDFVQPQLTKIGGLSMARKVSVLAELHNIAICPHSMRVGPGTYANVHWALTQEKMEWMEIPWIPKDLSFPSNVPELKMIKGKVQLPTGPGLGLP
jgi:L-alanine-DL-glutamate epimerase-like enolase superfamily enzyme